MKQDTEDTTIFCYVHHCRKCNRTWGHSGCNGLGNPTYVQGDDCWECSPDRSRTDDRWYAYEGCQPFSGRDLDDPFLAWVNSVRSEKEGVDETT